MVKSYSLDNISLLESGKASRADAEPGPKGSPKK